MTMHGENPEATPENPQSTAPPPPPPPLERLDALRQPLL